MTDDAYLATHLQEALASDPRVNEPELHVAIRGGRVQVTGDVPTRERKEAVTVVVHELAPALEVENLVDVTTNGPEPSVERLG